jgi:competence ComEA-like helix-hairpin-helix protein
VVPTVGKAGKNQTEAFGSMRTRIHAYLWALVLLLFLAANPASAKKMLPSHPLDLNVASVGDLEHLPGIGERTAKEIIDFRQKSGPFESVDDLLAIRGVSKQRLERIRPYIFVEQRRRDARPSTLRPSMDPSSFIDASLTQSSEPLV